MRAYSMDLRERALLDSDAGMKAADVAAKYRASTALERWPDASRNDENIRESRRDTVFSVVLGGLITAAVVVAASPLLGQGADAANAAAVAERLEPLLGRAAPIFA